MDLPITVSLPSLSTLPTLSIDSLLPSLCFQVTLYLLSLLSPPLSPNPLSHWEPSPAHLRNRSWPAVSQICSFHGLPTHVDHPRSKLTPIVWLESLFPARSGRERRDRRRSRGFPVLRGLCKPILTAGLTGAQGGPRKSVYQSQDLAASTEVVPKASPTPAQQLPTCPHRSPVHGLVHRTTPRNSHLFSMN